MWERIQHIVFWGLVFVIVVLIVVLGIKESAAIKDYQTLITGLAALVAAIWTVTTIRKQIIQTDLHRRDDLHRRFLNRRASLPTALTTVAEFAREIAVFYTDLLKEKDKHGKISNLSPLLEQSTPIFPTHAERTLINSIEYLPPEIAERIASLLKAFQLNDFHTKQWFEGIKESARRYNSTSPIGLEFHAHICSAVALSAEAFSMYGYALGETDVLPPPIGRKDVLYEIPRMEIDFPDLASLTQQITLRYPE